MPQVGMYWTPPPTNTNYLMSLCLYVYPSLPPLSPSLTITPVSTPSASLLSSIKYLVFMSLQ